MPLSQPKEPEPEWVSIARYRYLHDAEFHQFVDIIVAERLEYLREKDAT